MLTLRIMAAAMVAVIQCLSSALPVAAADDISAASGPAPSTQLLEPARQAVSPAVNSITLAAVKAGVLACASRINQVTSFLSSGSQSGVYLFIPAVQPDQQLFSASMEISNSSIPTTYASTSFVPNQANGCSALYEAVVYWPSQCNEVANTQYPGIKKVSQMGQQTAVLEIGSSVRVFLLPAGPGCLAIKKEIIQ